jgi:hypothetical protein
MFSREEWIYMAKVFAIWFLGGSLLLTLVMIWQMNWALSQFGGQEYLARVVTLAIPASYGPGLPIAAACNTLVMVTHRRSNAGIMQPVHPVPWWIAGCLGLTTPLAMALIFGMSLAIITYEIGVPWADSWKGIQVAFQWRYMATAVVSVVTTAAIMVALLPRVMHVLFRFRGWVILKCIVLVQLSGVVLYPVLSIWNAIVSP